MQATPRYYAIQVYGFPGHPFPKFYDSYKTMGAAKKAAADCLSEGWKMAEIYRDAPKQAGYFGVERELIETICAA
jgi:hypothetical protein